jgi:phospholipid/cholesterol/gamma-HCH transport system substrate-binding protein
MESKVNYAAVGVFVIGLGISLILAVLWLAAGGEFQHRTSRYESVSNESVAGLNVNAPVKLRGVDVGKVKSIDINPDNDEQVRLVYEIQDGTPIKTDTLATLTSQGLTGIAYVELSGGSASAPALQVPADGGLPRIPMRPSLTARLESVLSRVLASVDKTSANLNAVFSDENRAQLTKTLADLATITHTIAARKDAIDRMIANADRTMDHTATASAHIGAALDKVSHAADAVDVAADRLGTLGTNADRTVKDVGGDVHRFTSEALPQLEDMMNELSALAASLRRLSDQTAANPASLVRGTAPARKGPGE